MGQGTYTILAQTAAEVIGVAVEAVVVQARRFLAAARRRRRRFAARQSHDRRRAQSGACRPRRADRPCHQRSELAVPRPAGQYARRRWRADRLAARRRARALPSPNSCGASAATGSRPCAIRLPENARQRRRPLHELHDDRDRCSRRPTATIRCTAGARISSRCGSMRISARCASRASSRRWIPAGSTIPSSPKASGRAASSWASARRCLRRASSISRHGRVMNNNLGDYLDRRPMPTFPIIEVISVGIPDPHASALGGKARRRAWHRRRRAGHRQCRLPCHRQAHPRPADHAGEADLNGLAGSIIRYSND